MKRSAAPSSPIANSRAAAKSGAPMLRARVATAASASSGSHPTRTGIPGFTIPAFSRAMSARVGPRIGTWSIATVVTTAARGVITLVASSRPPSPHSTAANRTRSSAKLRNAAAVIISKKEGKRGSAPERTPSSASARSRPIRPKSAGPAISAAPMRIRSSGRTRWGLV